MFSALIFSVVPFSKAFAQNGKITGRIFNKINNQAVPFANVAVIETGKGAVTDADGKFEIAGLSPGLYNLRASAVGFSPKTVYEIRVFNSKPAVADFALEESSTKLEEVSVTASSFEKTEESPVSLRSIGVDQARRTPGANRDISKALRSLPGVTGTVSFRNDIIVRGGAPGENKYYVDGIEVPVINHFQTQGGSGGPVGLINVDFIKKVNFYSGAFPASRGNATSSVIEFEQKDGRDDGFGLNAVIGASDMGLTLEGPLSEKTTAIFSVRRSYLQFLFKALDLSFLPTYNDAQFKIKTQFNEKHQLSFIGLGAFDDLELNTDANDTKEQRYTLRNIPVNGQWNYAVGAKYVYFRDNGYVTAILSRNALDNWAEKYDNNDDSKPENLRLDYNSRETETHLRLETFRDYGKYSLGYGANYTYAEYLSETFNRFPSQNGTVTKDFRSTFGLNRWGAYVQANKTAANEKLTLSLGARVDANDYSSDMSNPLEQFSPRFSASYELDSQWVVNMNTGIFYQLPAYTVLGYRENSNAPLKNKENGLKYIRSTHFVAGVEHRVSDVTRITAEGFLKLYSQYPFLIRDQISLANLGGDFGVVGNDEVTSDGKGRAYGLEILVEQKLLKGFYGMLAYTLAWSEFADKNGDYVPSSWDSRHSVSLTAGKKFKKGWEAGLRWLFSSGAPFTPYDLPASVAVRDGGVVPTAGVLDYGKLNTERADVYQTLDLRVDKKFFYKTWTLGLYLDIQNLTGSKFLGKENIDIQRDDAGVAVINPANPSEYAYELLKNESGTTIPTIGVIIEL
ncbi:TonB-dependent receptor [Fulvitalea axinellae]